MIASYLQSTQLIGVTRSGNDKRLAMRRLLNVTILFILQLSSTLTKALLIKRYKPETATRNARPPNFSGPTHAIN